MTKLLKGKYIVFGWDAESNRGLQWGGTGDGCRSGEAGRETQQVGSASNMQKDQADGSPDRAVRKEMLRTVIKGGTQALGIIKTASQQ